MLVQIVDEDLRHGNSGTLSLTALYIMVFKENFQNRKIFNSKFIKYTRF